MILNERQWRVLVGGRQNDPNKTALLDVSDLDIEFRIRKNLEREPNTCQLKIYNLPQAFRRELEQINIHEPKTAAKKAQDRQDGASSGKRTPKPGNIPTVIYAGYKDGMTLLFRGDLRRAVTNKQDAGYITEIEGEDGGRSVLAARVTRSIPPGTTIEAAVRYCAAALGLGVGNILDVQADLQRTFAAGSVLDGSAASELAGILRRVGIRYSIQNGVLQFLKGSKGAASLRVQAPVISQETGLVGAPARDATGEIIATCLLGPDIYPGGYVQLESENFPKGLYSIGTIEHIGSTFGTEWYHRMWLTPA